MSERAIVKRQDALVELSIPETMSLGEVFAQSGFFADAKQAAQCVVKILAGRELGLGPMAAMNGVYIISGRVSYGANIIAAVIKASAKYDYRVRELSDKTCSIEFFEDGQSAGVSTFTMEDARRAQTKNLDKFPRNMLFSRALTNGARWYAPDVFSGAVYTPEELGAEVDEEGRPVATVDRITGEIHEPAVRTVSTHPPVTVEQPAGNGIRNRMPLDQMRARLIDLFVEKGFSQEQAGNEMDGLENLDEETARETMKEMGLALKRGELLPPAGEFEDPFPPGPAAEEPASNVGTAGTEKITPAQVTMLKALLEQAGETVNLDGMTRREASRLISELKEKLGQARTA